MNPRDSEIVDRFIGLTEGDVAQEIDSNSKHLYRAFMSKDRVTALVEDREKFIGEVDLFQLTTRPDSIEWDIWEGNTIARFNQGNESAAYNYKYLKIAEELTHYSVEELKERMWMHDLKTHKAGSSTFPILLIDLPDSDFSFAVAPMVI